jgi:hypothetical protein
VAIIVKGRSRLAQKGSEGLKGAKDNKRQASMEGLRRNVSDSESGSGAEMGACYSFSSSTSNSAKEFRSRRSISVVWERNISLYLSKYNNFN